MARPHHDERQGRQRTDAICIGIGCWTAGGASRLPERGRRGALLSARPDMRYFREISRPRRCILAQVRAAALLALPRGREQSPGQGQSAAQQHVLSRGVAVQRGQLGEPSQQAARAADDTGAHPHEVPQRGPDFRIEPQSRFVGYHVGQVSRGSRPSSLERQCHAQPPTEHQRFEQGIACEVICTVNPGARHFTTGPKPRETGSTLHVDGDAAHGKVLRRRNRDWILPRVDTVRQTQSVRLWKDPLVSRHDFRGVEPDAASMRDVAPQCARDNVARREVGVSNCSERQVRAAVDPRPRGLPAPLRGLQRDVNREKYVPRRGHMCARETEIVLIHDKGGRSSIE